MVRLGKKHAIESQSGKMKRIVLKENEEKIIPYICINESTLQEDMAVDLVGDGSRITIVGLFFGSGKTSYIYNTVVTHKGKNTTSRTILYCVLKDTASFSNDGMVRIEKGAKNADGYFTSKILLFDDAKGRSVPSLEIDENELKAGHASTVGRPDAAQLFYLQSRGLTEKEAQKLIVSGFFEPILQFFPVREQNVLRKKILLHF